MSSLNDKKPIIQPKKMFNLSINIKTKFNEYKNQNQKSKSKLNFNQDVLKK